MTRNCVVSSLSRSIFGRIWKGVRKTHSIESGTIPRGGVVFSAHAKAFDAIANPRRVGALITVAQDWLARNLGNIATVPLLHQVVSLP
jgi:hypothetical protein